jgi:glutathione-regulated potassium-efflux system ancillary protein KefG
MYELYPDFNIHIRAEQEALAAHDFIILQHPFYWYSCPPLMKQWMDLVLEHGWAYGKGGRQLEGKKLFQVISSGGTFEVYSNQGKNRFTYRELLQPFELTAGLCLMDYLPPFIIPGANKISSENLEIFAEQYRKIIRILQNGQVQPETLRNYNYWNQYPF